MADDFLLVAGTDWLELEDAPAKFASLNVDMPTLQTHIVNLEWNYISDYLSDLGLFPNGELIDSARLISTDAGESDFRFWYLKQ